MLFWVIISLSWANFGLEEVLIVVNRTKLEKTPFFDDFVPDFGWAIAFQKNPKFLIFIKININAHSRPNFAQEFEFNTQNYF